jgi:ubiquinone/menaquinone biosynthesis C-methylase UbiE
MLASHGVFRENPPGHFGQSPFSAFLCSDHPGSLRAPVIFWNEEQYRAWGDLLDAIKTGQTPFSRLFGSSWFDYYVQGGTEKAEIFNAAMAGWTSQIGAAVARACDFSPFRTVVDVGGGHGILLTCILEAFPSLRGVVADTETVVHGARRRIEAAGLSQRCSAVAVDFFKSIPRGGDAYILSQVLHDWNDRQCVDILRNCHGVMSPEGRILVVEIVIMPTTDSAVATVSDLHMLVVTGGRERTEAEYRDLFAQAGFRLTRVIPTQSPAHVIEGAPV